MLNGYLVHICRTLGHSHGQEEEEEEEEVVVVVLLQTGCYFREQ
jgi:hypothetical protein